MKSDSKFILWFLFLFYAFVFAMCWIDKANAQNPLHQIFSDEFTNKPTKFFYVENGVMKRENCKRLIGSYKPGLRAFSVSALRIDADKIPTACLAAQHFWMIFNLQQRAQAELKAEVELFKKQQRRLRHKCLVDDVKCGGLTAFSLINVSDYWIHFNAVEWQTREDYILHFKTGVVGLDTILAWRDWVKQQRINLERKR